MALVALRPFALGDHGYEIGDEIPPEVQKDLPAGRVEVLKTRRFVEEISQDVSALEARVAKLERMISKQPRKVA